MKQTLFSLGLTALTALLPAAASAFPDKPVTIISTSAAGSPGDVVARLVREAMSEELGQPVVIENRDAAGGALAIDELLGTEPDGYHVLSTGAGPIVFAPLLQKAVDYDVSALKPVVMLAALPTVLVANPSLGVSSVDELIALAKKEPGSIAVSSGGNGTPTHLASELMKQLTDIDILHIPYRGTSAAATAVLSNEVGISFSGPGHVVDQINSGDLVGLVVNDTKRLAILPDLPTAAEVGLPDFIVQGWFGFFVEEGTPDEVIDMLSSAALKALEDPEAVSKLDALGFTVVGSGPAEYQAYLDKNIALWDGVIKAAGIEPK
ncbi:Bug family tripartite tricarboxylate transporter substrate binding protein [Salipiger abyssi]|uniref:Bug family tripartite tricarboxylate transporter substrate binding protein n=1 Tax=Salipiger abyssi TaxID=1250539 RepID=UPI001A8C0C66|nr:tripartite tricarboxylate transporter substrate binding protein [Salipiger abyssi]MBN9887195.1 tripartite tricarboxylate transporter substrate binding protein [Salipiger abyssi]